MYQEAVLRLQQSDYVKSYAGLHCNDAEGKIKNLPDNKSKMYGDNKAITGGLAIRYNNVLTVEFRKGSILSGDPLYNVKDEYMKIKAKITKNHCLIDRNPYVTVEYTVHIGEGTDVTNEVIEEAFNQGVLYKGGAWIREYKDGIVEKDNERELPTGELAKWNGMAKFMEYLRNNPDYYDYLESKVVGNMQTESLSNEEIEELQEEDKTIGDMIQQSLEDN